MSAPKRIGYGFSMAGHHARWLAGPFPTTFDEHEYIRADLVPQWQPIETAPMERGKHILLWNAHDRCTYLGLWWSDGMDDPKSASWHSLAFGSIRPLFGNITHWMPLPESPE